MARRATVVAMPQVPHSAATNEPVRDKRQRVSVVTDLPIPKMFDFLSIPANHILMDGSKQLQASATKTPITGVGQTFLISMENSTDGSYEIENHVVEFIPDVQISWMPARPGATPVGVRWDWQFDVGPRGETQVTQTCDWSAVTDEGFMKRRHPPFISAEQMKRSITKMINLIGS